nr:MAG TPA: hypothetical protein [Caudoviricetes sp.]
MISPTEFYEGLDKGEYKTNVKIYQSSQTIDYNGSPMFEVEITTTKTLMPIKDDPYDSPYEFKLMIKRNQREINDFITHVKLVSLRWKSAEEVDKTVAKLERLVDDFTNACYDYQNGEYNSRSDYYAYLTLRGCYEYLSSYFDDLRYVYDAYVVRT